MTEFSWSSSDTLVARVDASGLVTAAANGNLSRAHVSRCAHWLIGSQTSQMPPELPQTCSCLQQPPSAGLVALQRPERARRGRPPTLATADRILAFMSDYDGNQHPKDSGIPH